MSERLPASIGRSFKKVKLRVTETKAASEQVRYMEYVTAGTDSQSQGFLKLTED